MSQGFAQIHKSLTGITFAMKDFKNIFIEEATGLLTNLEAVMLELEATPGNVELIQEVFRTMHTLKGISGMYGFSHISEYTHDLESIYDLIRNNKQELTGDITDITLASVDHLQNLLSDQDFREEKNVRRQEELMTKIKHIVSELAIDAKREELSKESKKTGKTDNKQIRTYFILFSPNEQLLFRGINIIHLFRDLAVLGEYHIVSVYSSREERLPNGETHWGIYLATRENIGAIEDVFVFVLDNCRIVKVSDHNLFEEENFVQKLENRQYLISIEDLVLNGGDARQDVPQNTGPVPSEDKELEKHDETNAKEVNDHESFRDISKQITSRVSVESEKLDELMYLVSELVITRAELDLIVEKHDYTKLDLLKEKVDKLTNKFRDNALSIRLVPINDILVRFRRLVRDLSQSMKKEIDFVTYGTETELDKNVMDALIEPILHLLRNSIDHGIEPPSEREAAGKPGKGQITLAAYHSGNNVYIIVKDDGNGIDPEFIQRKAVEKGFISPDVNLSKKEIYNLLFLPGFSTASNVTDISGRGVGMDVVKKKITEIRGEVEIDSEIGAGTSFTIKLQQTISILDTLMVETGDKRFLVPLSEVEFCGSGLHSDIYRSYNKHLEYENNLIPFVHLRSELALSGSDGEKIRYVILNKNNKRFAILIDKIIGEYQAVLKPLGRMLRKQEFLSGASIMGDGKLALMLNSDKLLDYAFGGS
jgi:two-component system, chemotaxis family, sensor kinase CheA